MLRQGRCPQAKLNPPTPAAPVLPWSILLLIRFHRPSQRGFVNAFCGLKEDRADGNATFRLLEYWRVDAI